MSALLSPIRPLRVRNLPRFYSWLDHRLVHDGHLKKLSSDAATFYLFLVTVGDRFGMSYYSDRAIGNRVNINDFHQVREELIQADLIAYAKPIYQVLSLPEKSVRPLVKKEVVSNEILATKEQRSAIFQKFFGGRR